MPVCACAYTVAVEIDAREVRMVFQRQNLWTMVIARKDQSFDR